MESIPIFKDPAMCSYKIIDLSLKFITVIHFFFFQVGTRVY